MVRADYTAKFLSYKGRNVLAIEDSNLGNMSVTNDIENVVMECFNGQELKPRQCLIVYDDSDGIWDGWDDEKQAFVPLGKHSMEDALDKYIEICSSTKS